MDDLASSLARSSFGSPGAGANALPPSGLVSPGTFLRSRGPPR